MTPGRELDVEVGDVEAGKADVQRQVGQDVRQAKGAQPDAQGFRLGLEGLELGLGGVDGRLQGGYFSPDGGGASVRRLLERARQAAEGQDDHDHRPDRGQGADDQEQAGQSSHGWLLVAGEAAQHAPAASQAIQHRDRKIDHD